MPKYLHMQIAKYVKLAFACPWSPSSGLYSPDPRACRLFGGICTRYPGEASPLPGSQGPYPSPHPYRLPPTPFFHASLRLQPRGYGGRQATAQPQLCPPQKGVWTSWVLPAALTWPPRAARGQMKSPRGPREAHTPYMKSSLQWSFIWQRAENY